MTIMPTEVDPQTTFVPMMHPDLDGTAMTTVAAYQEVWEPKGWQRITHETAEEDLLREVAREHSVLTPTGGDATSVSHALNPDLAADAVANLDSLSKDEVKAVAEQKGVDPSGTKADVVDRVRTAEGGEA